MSCSILQFLQNLKAILWQLKEIDRNPDAKDTLLFIYDTEQGKLVIKMDYYAEATDSQPQTKTIKTKMNMVVTGSLLLKETSWVDLKNSYQLLYGSL